MKEKLFFAALFLIIVSFGFNSVAACFSRGNGNPACKEFYESDAVFVGTVKGIEGSNVRLSVEESFLGIKENEIVIFDSPACGFGESAVGTKYLIYAQKDIIFAKGFLSVDGYSKIIEFPKAEKHVDELRGFLGQTDASIYGWAFVYDNKKLLNTKLTVSGNGKVYELQSDGSGKFDLSGLAVGKYLIKAEIPPKFKDNYGEEPVNEFSFELRKGECARFDFSARKKRNFWF